MAKKNKKVKVKTNRAKICNGTILELNAVLGVFIKQSSALTMVETLSVQIYSAHCKFLYSGALLKFLIKFFFFSDQMKYKKNDSKTCFCSLFFFTGSR
jgi:hypothetical protein